MAHETVGWFQEHEKFILPILEPISSYFSIPRLDDKPQDPIVHTIQSLPVQSVGGTLHDSAAQPLPSPAQSRSKLSSDVSTKPVLPPLWHEASLTHPQDVVSLPFVTTRGVI